LRIFGVFDENELDTRFIKGSIKRYINNEDMIIHQDKIMDFIYMFDLIKIIEYYINNEGPKEINCNYNHAMSLYDISKTINNLDKHKVGVTISKKPGSGDLKSYLGDATQLAKLPIPLIGFEKGLKLEYEKYKLCH
jgi:nucleoside-diphosphate-sugar epimerase